MKMYKVSPQVVLPSSSVSRRGRYLTKPSGNGPARRRAGRWTGRRLSVSKHTTLADHLCLHTGGEVATLAPRIQRVSLSTRSASNFTGLRLTRTLQEASQGPQRVRMGQVAFCRRPRRWLRHARCRDAWQASGTVTGRLSWLENASCVLGLQFYTIAYAARVRAGAVGALWAIIVLNAWSATPSL